MRYISTLILILLAHVVPANAQWIDFGFDGLPAADITIIESSATEMLVEVHVPGIEINQITREGSIYHQLSIPGTIPNATGEGHPSLPSVSFLAAIPQAGVSSITIADSSWTDLGVFTPSPMQPIPRDDSYNTIPFTIVPSSYQNVHPARQASWINSGILRGVNIGNINISPVRWDAATGILSASSRMLVRIKFEGTVSMDQRLHSRFWHSTFQHALVNADVLGSPVTTISSSTSKPIKAINRRQADEINAADLLIIAGDDFIDIMDEFLDKKTEQGFLTAMVAAGSWSEVEIRAYIRNAYKTWEIPPSFILFVGDSDDLTPYYDNEMYGDNRYCCIDGPHDYMADIYNGRFVTGADTYPGVERKILKWEYDPLMDADFWNNGLCAGMLQAEGDNTANRWFLFTCEAVRDTYQEIYGKTFRREYTKDTRVPPPYYYRNDLPSAGQEIPSDITWDGNAEGILNSINEGVFLVQHRDHGIEYGWGDPRFFIKDLSGLANGEKTPIIMSINCLTGKFVANCFAENLFARDNGAVAVVAAVEVSYSYLNDYLCYGIYKSFNDDFIAPPYTYTEPGGNFMGGQALICGKLEMQASRERSQYTEDEWDLFHWFGDPTMDMRTDLPQRLSVVAPRLVSFGATTASFSVLNTSGPVEKAMVCIQQKNGIWASGLTDTSGNITLNFNPIDNTETISYMVTAHNALPYRGHISLLGISTDVSASSVGTPYPNPATQSISFPVTLNNPGSISISIFDTTGKVVDKIESGQLALGSHNMVWEITQIPRGIYIARVVNNNGTVSNHRLVVLK